MSPMSLFLACLLAFQAANHGPAGASACELADEHKAGVRCGSGHEPSSGEQPRVAAEQPKAGARQSVSAMGAETSAATTMPSAGVAGSAPMASATDTADATDKAALARDTKSDASDAAVAALAKGTRTRPETPPETVRPPPKREEQRDRLLLRAGVGTFVSGALLIIPMAALLGRRAAGERELEVLNLDTAGRPTSAAEDATAAALGQRYTNLTAAVIALGIAGGALAVTGAVLLAMDARPRRVAVAPWGARGLGGLVLTGRF